MEGVIVRVVAQHLGGRIHMRCRIKGKRGSMLHGMLSAVLGNHGRGVEEIRDFGGLIVDIP